MLNERLQIFAQTTKDMLAQFGIDVKTQGKCVEPTSKYSRYDVLVIVGLTGDIKGSIVYNMSSETAKLLAGSMMGGMVIENFDDLTKSAVSEFSNMTSGNALTRMSTTGDITPPTMVTGDNLAVTIGIQEMLMTEISTSFGAVDLYLAIRK